MKAYHWAVVILLAVGAGYVGAIIQSEMSKGPADSEGMKELVLMSSEPGLTASDVGLMQRRCEVKVPAGHKLTVYICAYRDGVYDGDESLGIAILKRGEITGFAARLHDSEVLTGESGKVRLSFYAGGGRCWSKWIDKNNSESFAFSSGLQMQVGRICSFGRVETDQVNKQYPTHKYEFYGIVEPMTEYELKRVEEIPSIIRGIEIPEPPEGVPAKLSPVPVP